MKTKKNILQIKSDRLKKEPFRVPEAYFDSLENEIRKRISETERRNNTYIGYIKYAAAAVFFIVALSWAVLQMSTTPNAADNQMDMETSLVLNDLSEYEMMNFLEGDTAYDLEIGINFDIPGLESDTSGIISYLVDNDVSLDLIYDM